ncbi:hypothetical protein J6590_052218, partial [Homalodisca vitripennis]
NAQLCATGKHNMLLMGSARSSSIVRWTQHCSSSSTTYLQIAPTVVLADGAVMCCSLRNSQ